MRGLERIGDLVDGFVAWEDGGPVTANPLQWPGYAELVAGARDRAGTAEAVVTGAGELATPSGRTRPVALIASVFEFVGGSMGLAVGERVVQAYDRARDARLPVLVVARSGGARLQEGMLALVQMARVADAARRHAEAGLLQVAYLDSPTTGGVYASYASVADVLWAAPGALVGFAGPRVVEAATGEPLAPDAHTAESAAAAGLIDSVLTADAAREALATVLDVASGGRGLAVRPRESAGSAPVSARPRADAWSEVLAARAPDRPSGRAWLERLVPRAVALSGDRAGGVDPVVRAGLGLTASGRPVAYVALDRHTDQGRPRPSGYRSARRLIALAARLELPLLTLVDTPGADPSDPAEREGVAGEIARTLAAVTGHPAPTVSVVVGEGGSGGALALAATDRSYLLPGSIFSVLGPEGAAAILERDPARASAVAPRLRLTGPDLVELGVIDAVVAPDDVAAVIDSALASVIPGEGRVRLDAATRRWLHGD